VLFAGNGSSAKTDVLSIIAQLGAMLAQRCRHCDALDGLSVGFAVAML